MAEPTKIIRTTIHTFFQSYHSFSTIVPLLVLPTSASILLSQALVSTSPPLLKIVQFRLRLLFESAGFPASADFFVALNVKLSHTIFSFAFALPFTLTCLVLSKAIVIRIALGGWKFPPKPTVSLLNLYYPILQTQIWNSFAILSTNAVVFSVLFVAFNVAELPELASPNTTFFLSVAGAILYSVALAHVIVTCNLATVVAGSEGRGGAHALLKAALLVRGRATTAMTLAVVGNLGMAAVEALFEYRIVRVYYESPKGLNPSLFSEAFLIAYMHAIVIVLDIVGACVFFRSCGYGLEGEDLDDLVEEFVGLKC